LGDPALRCLQDRRELFPQSQEWHEDRGEGVGGEREAWISGCPSDYIPLDSELKTAPCTEQTLPWFGSGLRIISFPFAVRKLQLISFAEETNGRFHILLILK
jgi:hypothetical protein